MPVNRSSWKLYILFHEQDAMVPQPIPCRKCPGPGNRSGGLGTSRRAGRPRLWTGRNRSRVLGTSAGRKAPNAQQTWYGTTSQWRLFNLYSFKCTGAVRLAESQSESIKSARQSVSVSNSAGLLMNTYECTWSRNGRQQGSGPCTEHQCKTFGRPLFARCSPEPGSRG